MSGKTGWLCYAKKSGCDILYKKMKSKNVSLAVEIYPREGTETLSQAPFLRHRKLKFIPVRGRKPVHPQGAGDVSLGLKFIPVRGRKRPFVFIVGDIVQLKFIPVRGRKPLSIF